MLDFQKYDVADAVKCACGHLIIDNPKTANVADNHQEIVITCPVCASLYILILKGLDIQCDED